MIDLTADRHSESKVAMRAWLKYPARAGYAARGVVYLIVGGLALQSILGAGGGVTDSRGALQSLRDEAWGQAMLVVIALGLLAHAGWRFLQSAFDADNHGTDTKAIALRGGLLISSLSHLFLAVYAAGLALGWNTPGDEGDSRSWSATLLSHTGGAWALGAIGLGVIGAGIAQFVKGATAGFRKWLELSPTQMKWADPVCRFGLIMRGIVFCLIGLFLIVAAWRSSPDEARGLSGALDAIRRQPYGLWLLGITAFGLLAFSLYSFIEAASRRIHGP